MGTKEAHPPDAILLFEELTPPFTTALLCTKPPHVRTLLTHLAASHHTTPHVPLQPSHDDACPAAATILALLLEALSICTWPVSELASVQPVLLLHPCAPAIITRPSCCCWNGSRGGQLLRLVPVQR